MKSYASFGETTDSFLRMKQMSRRALARTLEARGEMSLAQLNGIINGTRVPTPRAMEIVARALHQDPVVFAEYRMWLVRRQLDPSEPGISFDSALKNLRHHEELEEQGADRLDAKRLADRLDPGGDGTAQHETG